VEEGPDEIAIKKGNGVYFKIQPTRILYQAISSGENSIDGPDSITVLINSKGGLEKCMKWNAGIVTIRHTKNPERVVPRVISITWFIQAVQGYF
jgi:hypothetical protein